MTFDGDNILQDHSERLKAGTLVAHYKIIRPLGAGGMGEVFLAEDTRLGRSVAIKFLPLHLTSDGKHLERFKQEARAASALNHPNIITIYEIGEFGDEHFIATEFIEGETLRPHLRDKSFGIDEILKIAEQVASALSAAHAAGIIHRDIKPENIMLRRDGMVKVLDFGLAKLAPQTAVAAEDPTRHLFNTGAGIVLGTAAYMSPEQARGGDIDARSDVFSLGAVLYEMVTGRRAFEGETASDMMAAVLKTDPPLISHLAPQTPKELVRITTKALRKDREQRYQSIKEMLLDLRTLQQDMEFEARVERSVTPDKPENSSDLPSRHRADIADANTSNLQTQIESAAQSTAAVNASAGQKSRWIIYALVFLLLAGATSAAILYLSGRNRDAAIESIAVLPFVNQTNDPDTEYLSDGITESVINSLAQLPNLRVLPRDSVFRYKSKNVDSMTVGRELGVRAVLTGRVVQRGDDLTISAELVDVLNNKQLWGQQYNRKLADALAIRQQLSGEITSNLRLQLSGDQRKQLTAHETADPEAYQAYLKGRYYWNKRTEEGFRKATEEFKRAADKDPSYALAYVGLADVTLLRDENSLKSASDTYVQAEAYAQQALRIDPSLAEAHASLASAYQHDWKWQQAGDEFRRAIELNPNYSLAHHWYNLHLRDLGKLDESLAESKRANELDPVGPTISTSLAKILLLKGDINGSIEQCKKVLEWDPNSASAHNHLGLAYLKQGRNSEALAELARAVELRPVGRWLGSLGYGYAITGKRAEALGVLRTLEKLSDERQAKGSDLASVYAGLGDRDKAFAWLERDFHAHSGLLARITWDIPFESLRGDPRYPDLVRRLGLKP